MKRLTTYNFQVSVAKKAGKQKIRAYGPGLEGGIVKRPAAFVVETIGEEIGQLGRKLF